MVWNPGTGEGPASRTVAVGGVPTTTTLASSMNPSLHGNTVIFTAEVTSGFGPPPNGETVSFMDGKVVLGTGVLSQGTATFATSYLRRTTPIRAFYAGDAEFNQSGSAIINQQIH